LRYIVIFALFLTVVSCNATQRQSLQSLPPHCHVHGGLPDATCTPGAVFASVGTAQICKAGYANSVRNVPQSEKDRAFAEYGIAKHPQGSYEVDHLISLELGGSNDLKNLWPEAALPKPGFHEKDQVENYLHDQVCSGKMALKDAQTAIAANWKQFLSNNISSS
jgi:hypothetical protein